MPNGHNEATRLLGVIDRMVEQRTKSGANIEVTYGQVFGVEGTVASVYLAGSRELAVSDGGIPEPSDGFRIPGYLRIVPGDYVRVSMDVRGHRWIDEYLLPLSESVDPPYSAILGSRQAILGEIILGGGPPTITAIAYPRLALDLANGIILFGDGTEPPSVPFGVGDILGGLGGVAVNDEGIPLATIASTLDFTGDGVSASGTGGVKTINIPGATPPIGGGISIPDIKHTQFAGTTASSLVFSGYTPVMGDRIILVLDGFNTGQATSVSSTNTTWTKLGEFNNAGGQKAALWVGVCAASPGGTITVTHPNSFMSMRVLVFPDTLTPTLVQMTSFEVSSAGVLTGVTPGNLIVCSAGADNTSVRNIVSPTGMVIVGVANDIVPLVAGYAIGPRIDMSFSPNAGAGFIAEIT